MDLFVYLFIFYFGAIAGSFLNVVILRLPQGASLSGRSRCVHCGRKLKPVELFPLFSFLILKGKCKNCRMAISWRYFTIELITGLMFLAVFLWQNPVDQIGYLFFLKSLVLIAVLIAVFVIDLEHYLILDEVLLAGGIIALGFNLILDLISKHKIYSLDSLALSGLLAALGFSCFFFSLWYVSKGKWMGFGDVKFMFFLGLALGWPDVLVCFILAFLLGTVFSLPLLILGKKTLSSKLPFGTFLSVAAALALFFGDKLFVWYLAVLGF